MTINKHDMINTTNFTDRLGRFVRSVLPFNREEMLKVKPPLFLKNRGGFTTYSQ